jgi:hypothetical protein
MINKKIQCIVLVAYCFGCCEGKMKKSNKAIVGLCFIALALICVFVCMANYSDAMSYLAVRSDYKIIYQNEMRTFSISAALGNVSLIVGVILIVVGVLDNRIVESHNKINNLLNDMIVFLGSK